MKETFDYVTTELLPSIWDKRRAYKKVMTDFLHMKETNID